MSAIPVIESASLLPILLHAFDGIALAIPEPWRLTFANPTLANWLGRPAAELRDQLLEEVFSAVSRRELIEQINRVWAGSATDAAFVACLQNDVAGLNPMHVRLCRVTVNDVPLIGVVLRSAADMPNPATPKIESRDPLTELPDRAFLLSRLAELLRGDRSGDRDFAVLFVDLDNFKQVNDGHGHLLGDRVLREVARRLSDCVRDGDRVARFGGDEFVVLIERVTGRAEIDPVIGRIHSALAKPIALPEAEFTLSVTIGVAEAAPEHHSPEDVLRDADLAMYAQKRERNPAG